MIFLLTLPEWGGLLQFDLAQRRCQCLAPPLQHLQRPQDSYWDAQSLLKTSAHNLSALEVAWIPQLNMYSDMHAEQVWAWDMRDSLCVGDRVSSSHRVGGSSSNISIKCSFVDIYVWARCWLLYKELWWLDGMIVQFYSHICWVGNINLHLKFLWLWRKFNTLNTKSSALSVADLFLVKIRVNFGWSQSAVDRGTNLWRQLFRDRGDKCFMFIPGPPLIRTTDAHTDTQYKDEDYHTPSHGRSNDQGWGHAASCSYGWWWWWWWTCSWHRSLHRGPALAAWHHIILHHRF